MSDMLGGLRCSYYDKMEEEILPAGGRFVGRFVIRFVVLDECPLPVLAALYRSMALTRLHVQVHGQVLTWGVAEPGLMRPRVQY